MTPEERPGRRPFRCWIGLHVLVRHAPEVGVDNIPYCYRCAGQWPCPDYRDAAAGLPEVPDER